MVTVITQVKVDQVLLRWFAGSLVPAFGRLIGSGGVVPAAIGRRQLLVAPAGPLWLVVVVMWLCPVLAPVWPVYICGANVDTLRLTADRQSLNVSQTSLNISSFKLYERTLVFFNLSMQYSTVQRTAAAVHLQAILWLRRISAVWDIKSHHRQTLHTGCTP